MELSLGDDLESYTDLHFAPVPLSRKQIREQVQKVIRGHLSAVLLPRVVLYYV